MKSLVTLMLHTDFHSHTNTSNYMRDQPIMHAIPHLPVNSVGDCDKNLVITRRDMPDVTQRDSNTHTLHFSGHSYPEPLTVAICVKCLAQGHINTFDTCMHTHRAAHLHTPAEAPQRRKGRTNLLCEFQIFFIVKPEKMSPF